MNQKAKEWLLDGMVDHVPTEQELAAHQHPWWQVMCLTGVDYFSSVSQLLINQLTTEG